MSVRAILFDLDGTLLPMDQERFLSHYFHAITSTLAKSGGYEPERLGRAIWKATAAMLKNDGSRTNEARFWDAFSALYEDRDVRADEGLFAAFYEKEFLSLSSLFTPSPDIVSLIQELRARGMTLVLATNPVFPAVATRNRLAFAGLDAADCARITTYENATFAKPSLGYYREIADALRLRPEECIMVGNDVADDMPARQTGMEVFLLTPCLINKEGAPIDAYPHGNVAELRRYLLEKIDEEEKR